MHDVEDAEGYRRESKKEKENRQNKEEIKKKISIVILGSGGWATYSARCRWLGYPESSVMSLDILDTLISPGTCMSSPFLIYALHLITSYPSG